MSRTIPPIWHATGTWEHALGTDSLGRDYLTRIMYGGRIALITAFGVVLIAGTLGSALGIAAGYFGGKVDQIGRAHAELQSLMRISYAVFCLKKKNNTNK